MADKAHEQATINAPVESVFDALVDFERYPEWAGDLKQATIVERWVKAHFDAARPDAEYGLADPGPGGPLQDEWFRYISDNVRAGRGR